MIKRLFWKTYLIRFRNKTGKLYNVQCFRGATWEVVEMAFKEAKERSEKENDSWSVWEIIRIY